MSGWCWHRWLLVSREVLPSEYEDFWRVNKEMGVKKIKTGESPSLEKQVIVHYRCTKCNSDKVVRV